MRRKDREITDIAEIYKVMDECVCCRVGFNDDGNVYIVPLNFGYTINNGITTLYFHSANEGRKISLINKSNNVGFEMDAGYNLTTGDIACDYTASFKSIIGNGIISIVQDETEKINALNLIMFQSTKRKDWTFSNNMLEAVCIIRLEVSSMSCKIHL